MNRWLRWLAPRELRALFDELERKDAEIERLRRENAALRAHPARSVAVPVKAVPMAVDTYWCESCALPSGVHLQYAIEAGGQFVRFADERYCRDCGRGDS